MLGLAILDGHPASNGRADPIGTDGTPTFFVRLQVDLNAAGRRQVPVVTVVTATHGQVLLNVEGSSP